MNTPMVRKVAMLSLALLIGFVALAQVFHDDSQAIGLCHASCKCVRCGWAQYPARPCIDWVTWCSGPGLVRNCSSYCGLK